MTDNPGQQGMHQVHSWAGTPYEIGSQHGRALRQEIREEYEPALLSYTKSTGWSEARVLDYVIQKFEPVFGQLVPRALEEIRGLSEGSGLSYERAFFAATRDGLSLRNQTTAGDPACTAFVCGRPTTAENKMFIGQTKDTSRPLGRYHILRLAYNDGLRMVVLNYPGWIGNICLTSHGLSFSGNSLPGRSANFETMPMSLLKRLIMEKESVREVLRAASDLKFGNGCFLIADTTGQSVCIECVGGQMDVRDISDDAFGHANTALAPALLPLLEGSKPIPSSAGRLENIQRLLDAGRGSHSVETLQKVLADHAGFPLSICHHRSDVESDTTTAAYIAELDAGVMHIAIGNPCVAPFVSYAVPS